MSSVPSPVPPLKARLVCRIRPGVTERFRVQGEESVVGREPGLAVTVPVDGVSRRHAKIKFDGKSYWIENMSPAGTFVNGSQVARERLRHLDVVTLGKKVDLLFLLRDEAQSPTTTEGIVNASLLPEAGDAVEIAQGEILIGRSSANNLILEQSSAVSKVHARIERSPQQLILQDLGSSNGSFVNGERVMTALLKHGDVLSFANVVSYRVQIERGPIQNVSMLMPTPAAAAATPPEKRQQFSPEWKTRYDWDSDEIKEIADLQAKLRAEDADRRQQKEKKEAGGKPGAKAAPGAAKPAPPAAAKPAAPAAAAKPAAPAAAKPAAPAAPAAVPSIAKVPIPVGAAEVHPAVPAPEMPEKVAPAPPAAKAPVPPPARPAPPVAAKPAAPAPRPPAPAAPPPEPPEPESPAATMIGVMPVMPVSGAVREVRLMGPAGELVVTEPGDYNLGRAKDAPLRVDNPTVSRKHARIVLTEDRGKAYIQDTGGANGTRLNGVVVERLVVLSDGDVIGVGDVELRVKLKRG
jgi:pSer/pThr/pTyr-binding forkhead associated (FHA) protein